MEIYVLTPGHSLFYVNDLILGQKQIIVDNINDN